MLRLDILPLFWFWYVFVPGLIYVWLRKGFRGKSIPIYLWESFLAGTGLAATGVLLSVVIQFFVWGSGDASEPQRGILGVRVE